MKFKLEELDYMLDNGMAVYEHYYPVATGKPLGKLHDKMLSPFREEKNPSFSIYPHRTTGKIIFKDHGIDKIGSHWQFVMDLYNLDFKEAVALVKKDLLGIDDDGNIVGTQALKIIKASYKKATRKVNSRVELYPGYRDWDSNDLEFFSGAGISPATLAYFNASALAFFDMTKEGKTIRIRSNPSDPMYGFTFPSGRHKIYRPFTSNPRYKWTSNLVAEEDIFGFKMLPKSCEHLFMVGGNRDCMSFHENIGIPVISLASESANLTEELYSFLRHTAKNIWVLYDYDKQGTRKSIMFNEQFGLPYLNTLYEKYARLAGTENMDFVELYQNGYLEPFKKDLYQAINV